MKTTKRLAAVCTAAALTILSATGAYADDVDNDLTEMWGATDLELMTLQYDSVDHIAGSNGSTLLTVYADPADGFNGGGPNAAGCNFVGNKTLSLEATTSTSGIANVSFLNDDSILSGCGDSVTVVVTPTGVGDTDVTFDGLFSTGGNAAMNKFDLSQADFHVRVNEADLGTGGGGATGCDADPAAPAWAAAILQASGIKPNSAISKNAISTVARHMDPTASFDGVAKDGQFSESGTDYSYANKVRDYLVGLTGNQSLASVEAAKRPGWNCTALPTS